MKKLKHNHYTNSLSKDAILSENADLKKKKKRKRKRNAGISKIKGFLVLRSIFLETPFVCVFTY